MAQNCEAILCVKSRQKIFDLLRTNWLLIVFICLSLFILLFLAVPIVTMIFGVELESFQTVLHDPAVTGAIFLSLYAAFIATIFALIFGVPLGYLLARREFMFRSVVQAIVDLPVVVPHTVAGIALLTVFSAEGIFGAPLSMLGLKFVDAMPGIVIAMLFVSVPFMINHARVGFQAVNPRLEHVARSLGASQARTFLTISLPLASRAIFTGAVMTWARAISEFGAVMILAYYPMVAPTLIYERFSTFGLYNSRPIAVLLVLVCLLLFVVLTAVAGEITRKLRK